VVVVVVLDQKDDDGILVVELKIDGVNEHGMEEKVVPLVVLPVVVVDDGDEIKMDGVEMRRMRKNKELFSLRMMVGFDFDHLKYNH
jgi:hypothetical protein